MEAPAWVTLEVAAGGFATGKLAAAGPLRPHELALLDSLGLAHDDRARDALNAYFLTDEGLAELRLRLRDGTYRLDVPEEAALLVVAWLLDHDAGEPARAILDAIAPWRGQLRFYPVPHAEPELDEERVHLQPVAATARQLEAIGDRERFLAEREAVTVWAPLVDRLVRLVAETEADGWPCQSYPDEWRDRALAAVFAVDARRVAPHRCREPDRPRSNLARLAILVERAAQDPLGLTGREVGELRGILLRIELRRGAPGSPRLIALRAEQAARVARPTRRELAREVAAHLRARPGDHGLEELGEVPPALRPIVQRSLDAAPEALIAAGVIDSAATLATLVPQLAAPVVTAGVRDPDLARLLGALGRAFRRRRSLFLGWLAREVTLDELPWASAILAEVDAGATRVAARAALRRVVDLAVVGWPHAGLPRALLRELRALATLAGLEVPLVDGWRSDEVLAGAQRAARRIDGTLYATYYGVPCAAIARMQTRSELYAVCEARAGTADRAAVLEQLRILTTDNLAPLIGVLGMSPRLAAALPALARRAFTETCRLVQLRGDRRRAIRHAAHAWRQMLAFLALAPHAVVEEFLMWTSGEIAALPAGERARFGPAYAGLCLAATGVTATRPLLAGSRWLLDED